MRTVLHISDLTGKDDKEKAKALENWIASLKNKKQQTEWTIEAEVCLQEVQARMNPPESLPLPVTASDCADGSFAAASQPSSIQTTPKPSMNNAGSIDAAKRKEQALRATLDVFRSVPDIDQREELIAGFKFTFRTRETKPSKRTFAVVCQGEQGFEIRFKHPERRQLQDVTNSFILHALSTEKRSDGTRVIVDREKDIPVYESGHDDAIEYGTIQGFFLAKVVKAIKAKPVEFGLSMLFIALALGCAYSGFRLGQESGYATKWWAGALDRLFSAFVVSAVAASLQVVSAVRAPFSNQAVVYWDHR